MPSAIGKAAEMRVVPETYRRAMEAQVDVDKVEQHIRRCTNGYWKHFARTNTGTRSWQFQPEYHVKLTRGVGQIPRSEQL